MLVQYSRLSQMLMAEDSFGVTPSLRDLQAEPESALGSESWESVLDPRFRSLPLDALPMK